MKIGDAAKALGVSTSTLKRCEARGVIKPARDWCGVRQFTEDDLVVLKRYVRGKRNQRRDRKTKQFVTLSQGAK